MNQEPTMRGEDLADFLQVHPNTLHHWKHHDNFLPDDRAQPIFHPLGHPLYFHSTIETFLRDNPNCPGAEDFIPPLSEQLILQEILQLPALMTRQQVMAWLEIGPDAVDTALLGDLPSIRLGLGGSIRIPLGALIDYAEVRKGEGAVSAKFAMKLLGLSIKKVATLSSKSCGLLTRQHVPGSHGEIYIVTESLMALMAAHVATGTAEDWWRLRVRNNFEPLLTLETIRTTHTVHERTIRSLIDDGTFPCLYVPGTTKKITRVSQHAVEMWAWQRTRISNAWLSFICGAPLEQVAIWADNKQFCRLKHGRRLRADACPSLGCITEYIATHQTMTFDPEDWITQCLEKRRYPVPISNLSIEDDNELKKLRGLRLPDGSVVVMHADAVAQQARAGLAARTRFLTSPLHKA